MRHTAPDAKSIRTRRSCCGPVITSAWHSATSARIRRMCYPWSRTIARSTLSERTKFSRFTTASMLSAKGFDRSLVSFVLTNQKKNDLHVLFFFLLAARNWMSWILGFAQCAIRTSPQWRPWQFGSILIPSWSIWKGVPIFLSFKYCMRKNGRRLGFWPFELWPTLTLYNWFLPFFVYTVCPKED